jgi:membrane protein implicated in regulation of membrane protease activity
MAWQGGGRGVLFTLAAVIFAPMLGTTGLVALLIGALFDVSVLVTLGLVLVAVAAVALLFVLWKALSALRAAQRMMGSGYAGRGGMRRDPADDDRISGRWGSSDNP